jgi:hypothetical protein
MRRNRRRHDAAEREHAKLWGIGTESANACLSQRLLLLKAQPIHYCKPLPVSRSLTCSRRLERIEWRLWHGGAGEALFRTRGEHQKPWGSSGSCSLEHESSTIRSIM